MRRVASAEWKGTLKDGKGKIKMLSGALPELAYSFDSRFGYQMGASPEELIAAAHAGCFTMALSGEIEKCGLKSDHLHTDATVTLIKDLGKWSVANVHLSVYGSVPGATPEIFQKAAREAKENCPISLLLNTNITLEADLVKKAKEKPLLLDKQIYSERSTPSVIQTSKSVRL